jgi:DNA-binding MarR family transcriptional regulator
MARRSADVDADGDASRRALAERLARVTRLLRTSSSRAEIAGLSNARYDLMHALIHGGPMRMGAAANQLGISARTITPMVDALENDGLLTRTVDPTDRRAQVLALTPAGKRLMHKAHTERMALAARIFEPLDDAEQATLSALLEKIVDGARPEAGR